MCCASKIKTVYSGRYEDGMFLIGGQVYNYEEMMAMRKPKAPKMPRPKAPKKPRVKKARRRGILY